VSSRRVSHTPIDREEDRVSEDRLPAWLRGRLRIPAIAAPMLRVPGPELVVAACRAGVVGAFPTANACDPEELSGWLNPLAFVRAVREWYDGPVLLAGGITDGATLAAIKVLGCDLGYLGTAFLATHESRADPDYKQRVVDADIDDVLFDRSAAHPAQRPMPQETS
jgi:NAD(P)H-dependent flavin oxidoreductase YrpB (nitropropane dioxygenase family)